MDRLLLLEDLKRRLGMAHEQIGEALVSIRRVNTMPLDDATVGVRDSAGSSLVTAAPDDVVFQQRVEPTIPLAPHGRIIFPPDPSGENYGESVRRHRGSGFKFGSKSKRELEGVHPILVEVATLALDFSTQDFMIFDGLRTEEEQRNHVRRGNSKTMHSKHLPQRDGLSHAVDAVPTVGTIPKWEWDLVYPVVMAFDKAATELDYADKIVWGGAWDRRLSDFGGNKAEVYRQVVQDYAARNPGKDFLDGPHFELRL